jgi:protoporphyrinogen/coproporphyrinogen III oxidase
MRHAQSTGVVLRLNASPPVAIIGAGLAGLTAAWKLARHGIPVAVYEASGKVAGLAASYRDQEGFSHDFGAHFITNRLAAAVGISGECLNVERYSETVLVNGQTYQYPFGLLRQPRFLTSALSTRMGTLSRAARPRTAKDWFEQRYGVAFAREIALPLIEAWSGVPSTQLAPSVAESLPSSILHTIYLKFAGHMSHRPVAIGYSRSLPETPHVWHVYPRDGIATLCRRLADEVGESITLNSPVEKIFVEANRVRAIQVHGERYPVAAVVSTLPYHVLGKIVDGTDALVSLKRFRYRPMIFVNMRFAGRGLLPDVVLWTPEPRYTFFRLTEVPLAMPWLAPEGKTIITADIGCEVGDATWTMKDDDIAAACLSQLRSIVPDASRRFLGASVLRTPIAYPVFDLEYEDDRQRYSRSLGVDGLHSIGRNGKFAHIFMEDVYWFTLAEMGSLIASFETTDRVARIS